MFALEFMEFYQKNQLVALLDLSLALLYFVMIIASARIYSKFKKKEMNSL